MNSEKWCSVAKKLFTVIAVLIVVVMFISALIQALTIGSVDAGQATLNFFIQFITACITAAMWWFVTRWCIFVLEELIAARKDREKLRKTLFESYYKESKDAPADGYFRFTGKQVLKTNELLENIAAYLAANAETIAQAAKTDSEEEASDDSSAQDDAQ